MKVKNVIFGIVLTLIASFATASFSGKIFQGSVLSIFNRLGMTDFEEAYPDLAIEYATMQKIADPSADSPFYKYAASVVVRNYGDSLLNGDTTLHFGNWQNVVTVRNSLNGLSLVRGQTFVLKNYEISMNANSNFGRFNLYLKLKNEKEKDYSNNSYTIEILEDPAKVENFSFDGEYFSYEYPSEKDLFLCHADPSDIDYDELKYNEIIKSGAVYSYYKSRPLIDHVASKNLNCEKVSTKKIGDFKTPVFAFLKSCVDGEACDQFAVSNFIILPNQKYLTKAEFAKVFVEESGMPMDQSGKNYFKDVSIDDHFFPYIQTLFNQGLLTAPSDFKFNPNQKVARKDVLEPVLHYFDIDLDVSPDSVHFSDFPQTINEFYFVETFVSNGMIKSLKDYFYPNKQASSEFVKYLINEVD